MSKNSNKIVKWVLQESEKGKPKLFLSVESRGHSNMVELGDSDILLLDTREIARNYAAAFEKLTVKKVVIQVID